MKVATNIMPRPVDRSEEIASIDVEFIATDIAVTTTVLDAVRAADAVAVDTETHDAETREDGLWMALRVISIATRNADGSYRCFTIDVKDLSRSAVASVMDAIELAHGWNADFDEEVLERYGTPLFNWRDVKFDEMIFWAGFPGRSWYLALSEAARRYLNYSVEGKGSVQTSYDADSKLNDAQIRYAGLDALITLFLAEVMYARNSDAGLSEAADIEQGQRRFLRMLMSDGFPFDLDGWTDYVDSLSDDLAAVELQLAALTGGTDGKLSFNPSSAPELRAAFNTYESEIVSSYFSREYGDADPVDADAMKQLRNAGSKIADAILEFRKINKFLTTYGEDFAKFCRDGRIRSRYKQTITATGRLASDKPNGQNLPGKSKEFITAPEGRVLIDSDYSQAELRSLAEDSGDVSMLTAFRAGKDFHAATALDAFGVDMDELKKTDPDAAKAMRTKAKGVNFGIPYGMAAAALARRLSNEGVETSVDEAKDLIAKIMQSRPEMAAWLNERDAFVRLLAKNPGPVDWAASFKLLELWHRYDQERRNFRRREGYWPGAAELVEATISPQLSLFEPELTDEERAELVADVDWAFRYDAPVVVRPPSRTEDGTLIYEPVAFESRTKSGRRRLFAIVMDSGYQRSDSEGSGGGAQGFAGSKRNDKFSGLLTAAMLTVATTDKEPAAAVRDSWAKANHIELPTGVKRCRKRSSEDKAEYAARKRRFELDERARCVKAFEGSNRKLKLAFVRDVCKSMGDAATDWVLAKALTDSVGALGPAFRNHPIQGGVADIVGVAFAELFKLTDHYPDLVWVQTVHDSIIGECDEANAHEIAVQKKQIMERAMNRFYPEVPAKVDTEIRSHLGDGGLIETVESVSV